MTEKVEKELYEIFESHNNNSNKKLEPEEIQYLVDGILETIRLNTSISKVKEFMNTFNQKIRTKPEIPTVIECLFRLELLQEELIELAEACGSEVLTNYGLSLYKKSEEIRALVENKREDLIPNLVGCLDAFKDLEYVLAGAELTFGMQDISKDAFEEVHSSNMSKACDCEEDVQATIEYNKNKGVNSYAKHVNGVAIILRGNSPEEGDQKVLKSINYKPANLDQFIYPSL